MTSIFSRLKRLLGQSLFPVTTWSLGIETGDRPDGNALMDAFLKRAAAMQKPRVLELGTKRSVTGRSTLHRNFVPSAGEYLGTDIDAGPDVDFVADVHNLTKITGVEQFDVIISCSTFEHFKYPHLAAHELTKALRIGGIIFIQTHQSFPIHSYPYDYFRFSREALAGLFGKEMGFNVIATDYEFPARVVSARVPAVSRIPSYLNVRLYGEKIAPTPSDFIYELDTRVAI